MKLPSSRHLAAAKSVLITQHPLFLEKVVKRVLNPAHGAIVVFCGAARDVENGIGIKAITYQAYLKMAEKQIEKIIKISEKKWGVKIMVNHRIGKVPAGENSLIVACSGVHRQEAFKASQFVINQIKSKAPIWKIKFHKKDD